tara:strand:- start:116 stop:241 length:126 start_codon:yes stop_codon:yes gene_type:complete
VEEEVDIPVAEAVHGQAMDPLIMVMAVAVVDPTTQAQARLI